VSTDPYQSQQNPQNPQAQQTEPNQHWTQQPYQYGAPQPQQGWQQQPAPAPKKGGKFKYGCLAVVGVAVVSVVAVVAIAVSSSGGAGSNTAASSTSSSSTSSGKQVTTNSGNTGHSPTADVTITTCRNDSVLGLPQASLKIVNHSGKASDYMITMEFLDSHGTRIAEGDDFENNVGVGEAVKAQASGSGQGTVSKCQLVSVDRTASAG
jgi:hypothetical protein